jgi:hypothetical protein
MRIPHGLRAVAGFGGLPDIGASFQGGYFAGLISHSANGVATHALVVAPKGNETTAAWQTSSSITGATSTFNGAANTALMTNSPAANHCKNYTGGGYTDWFLPARLELDIAYFNLKPTTTDNSTTGGINAYSVPPRSVSYTVSNPARTSVAAFQAGGAQAFADGGYWSSTEATQAGAWILRFNSGSQQINELYWNGILISSKSDVFYIRPFRKVAL